VAPVPGGGGLAAEPVGRGWCALRGGTVPVTAGRASGNLGSPAELAGGGSQALLGAVSVTRPGVGQREVLSTLGVTPPPTLLLPD
jgi:hypothetical protein